MDEIEPLKRLGIPIRYSYDPGDYFDIYDRYDLLVAGSADLTAMAASLGIASFVILDSTQAGRGEDRLYEIIDPGRYSIAMAVARVVSVDTQAQTREIWARRFAAREAYGQLIRGALVDQLPEPETDRLLQAMARALNTQDDHTAIIAADRVLDVDSKQAGALHGKAHALNRLDHLSSASRLIDRALVVASRNESVAFLATEIRFKLGQPEAVRSICQRAIKSGIRSASILHQMGLADLRLGEFDNALKVFDQAIALNPEVAEIHFSRALALLSAGRLPEGFKEYEWRWKMNRFGPALRTDRPRWGGESLAGKRLLVTGEQGYGDRIQFIRFMQLLHDSDVELIYHCPAPLQALFQRITWVSELSLDGLTASDYWVPVLSLPLMTGLRSFDDVPSLPYLEAGERNAPHRVWARQLHGFKVGVVWRSNETDPDVGFVDPSKSARTIPIDLIKRLARLDGVTLIALDPNVNAVECQQLELQQPGPRYQTFADTADVIEEMDLVISIDTATAHLAGAMGKTVWTLLPRVADWRWGQSGSATPWYPSMTLFRQKTSGSWEDVISDVEEQVRRLNRSG